MKYISLDVETTGLNPYRDQVLEIGMVLDDLTNPVPLDELPRFHCYVKPHRIHGNIVALSMNARILDILVKFEKRQIPTEELKEHPVLAPKKVEDFIEKWLKRNGFQPGESLNIAGKNPAGFDIPFLEGLLSDKSTVVFRHRVIDPSTHFWEPGDVAMPNLNLCLKRAFPYEETLVTHRAVDDAMAIVRLVRKIFLPKMKIHNEPVPF